MIATSQQSIHARDIFGNYSSAGTAVVSGTTVDAFGNWQELIADIGDRDILILNVLINLAESNVENRIECEIGIGASASEVRNFGLIFRTGLVASEGQRTSHEFTPNKIIPASSRISARMRDSTGTVIDYTVSINYKKL